jgi:hypothetical protein
MHRLCAQASLAVLLATAASAQCLTTGGVAAGLGNPDEALSAVLPMGISFPMAGAAGAPFTHLVVSSNGVVYLTTGGAAADATANQHGSLAELQGTAGASPRIAPFWSDLWDAYYPGAAWSVDVDTSVPGRCAVVWSDCCEWPWDTPALTFEAELFDTGVVTFSYGDIDTGSYFLDAVVGLSIGDAVADPGASDLSAAPFAATGIAYQVFAPGTFDLSHTSISFTPNGAGYDVSTSCQVAPASHLSYGVGCYSHSDSFYQWFADASLAAPALSGQSMVLTPTANGYSVAWGGGTFDVPTAPTTLALTDDGEVVHTPSSPLPTPGGPETAFRVHANGLVAMGLARQTFPGTSRYEPTPQGFLDAGSTAFWSWHDYNVEEVGSGVVTAEEKVVGPDTILYLTWNGVESYADPEVANPSTLQFQFHLGTGVVTIVWQGIDADASSPFGSAHLVGYSPGGVSPDGGNLDLGTALPLTTTAAIFPLQLDADPAPISTAGSGTLVTFTTSNIPEAAPGSGVFLGLHVLSFGATLDVDLGFLGAPGCLLHLAGLDIVAGLVGSTPTLSNTFFMPPGITPGTVVWSQSASLVVPFTLPNGENALGMTTSNAVRTEIRSF